MLRQIDDELGPDSDLGKAATQAAGFLDQRVTQIATRQAKSVAFRRSTTLENY